METQTGPANGHSTRIHWSLLLLPCSLFTLLPFPFILARIPLLTLSSFTPFAPFCFSLPLTASHCFALLRTGSHCVSLYLTVSHYLSACQCYHKQLPLSLHFLTLLYSPTTSTHQSPCLNFSHPPFSPNHPPPGFPGRAAPIVTILKKKPELHPDYSPNSSTLLPPTVGTVQLPPTPPPPSLPPSPSVCGSLALPFYSFSFAFLIASPPSNLEKNSCPQIPCRLLISARSSSAP